MQDKKGFLWIGTLDGLNRYDGYNFVVYKNELNDSLSLSNNRVTKIFEDLEGNLWLAGKNSGVNRFAPKSGTFSSYVHNPGNEKSLVHNEVKRFYITSDSLLAIDTDGGRCTYNSNKNYFDVLNDNSRPIYLPSDIIDLLKNRLGNNINIRTYLIDKNGNHWVSVRKKGLFRVDKQKRVLDLFSDEMKDFDINVIYEDKSGLIWIGTENNGLLKFNPASVKFGLYSKFINERTRIDGFAARGLARDKDGNIWIATIDKGVIRFNPEKAEFENYRANDSDENSIIHDKVRSVYPDSEGNIWIGSYYGLSKYVKEINGFQTVNIIDENIPVRQHRNYRAYDIIEDNESLWVANWENLVRINKNTNEVISYPRGDFGMDNIRTVFIDSEKYLWVGAEFGGLLRIALRNGALDISSSKNYTSRLSSENIYDIFQDKSGVIWVATFNGLNKIDLKKDSIGFLTTKDGLPSNLIYGVLEDNDGFLWITTSFGVAKMSKETEECIQFNENHGLQGNEFTENSYYINSNADEIIIGGTHGINIFNPGDIVENRTEPDLAFIKLRILNKEINPNQELNNRIILPNSIEYTNKLVLERTNRVISLEFSALHYKSPKKNKYKYKLEGFDDDWNETDASRRFATYTNLPPGEYVFKLKGSNSDDVWNKNFASLSVEMLPAWWQTLWFKVFSFLVIAGIVILIITIRTRALKKRQVVLEERVESATKALNVRNEKLQETKEKLAGIMDEVKNKLGKASEKLTDAANQQASTVEEMAASIEEMSATVLESTNNVRTIFHKAQNVKSEASESVKTVQEAVSSLKTVSEKNAFVSDIARETKILSLNAAVEAARAGNYGKSFAVVAREVQNLSERSQSIVGEINKISVSGLQQSKEASTKINEMLNFISEVVTQIEEVTTSSQVQSAETERINEAITEISSKVSVTAMLAQDLDDAINSMTIDE